jgi:hypothetical protein
MTADEEENAVRQLCDLIGAERVGYLALRMVKRRFECGRDDCWEAGKCLNLKRPCWAKQTPGA